MPSDRPPTPGRGRRCSLARTVDAVGDFWTLLVIRDLWSYGPQRFDQLHAGLDISTSTLTNRLGRLVSYGIVARRLYQRSPERYEYCLTESGADLLPGLMMLTAWGDAYLAEPPGPTAEIRHGGEAGAGGPGHRARPVVVCGDCGEPLTLASTQLAHGPGAPAGARPFAAGSAAAHARH